MDPSNSPSTSPSSEPSGAPSSNPSMEPSFFRSFNPLQSPSASPSDVPSVFYSSIPSIHLVHRDAMPMVVSPVNGVGVASMVPSQSLSFAPSRVTDEMDGSSPVETDPQWLFQLSILLSIAKHCRFLDVRCVLLFDPWVNALLFLRMRLDCVVASKVPDHPLSKIIANLRHLSPL